MNHVFYARCVRAWLSYIRMHALRTDEISRWYVIRSTLRLEVESDV